MKKAIQLLNVILIVILISACDQKNQVDSSSCFDTFHQGYVGYDYDMDVENSVSGSYNIMIMELGDYREVVDEEGNREPISIFNVIIHEQLYLHDNNDDNITTELLIEQYCEYNTVTKTNNMLGYSSRYREFMFRDRVYLVTTTMIYEDERVLNYVHLVGYDKSLSFDEQNNEIREIIEEYRATIAAQSD